MPLDPLSQLAIKYNSDKWSAKHSYTAWYWEQFKDRRDTVRKVVEIGVGEGASLRMWAEFFPRADIWGLDNDRSRHIFTHRIFCFDFDQGNADSLNGLGVVLRQHQDIDLFIDDGSHREDDQVNTCLAALPNLSGDATYVIEDVAEVDIARRLAPHTVFVPALEKRVRYDNRLFVVKHA